MGHSEILPSPPTAHDVALPWDEAVLDPIEALSAARSALGDSFVVDSGQDRYFFTFSPVGVASFYALPEDQASKGVADWRMLRRKLPDEIFLGRRTLPHELFGRDDVANYLTNVNEALLTTVDELGHGGDVDIFALTRRLGHRVGLASWGGPGAATGTRFETLARAFDALDGSDAFVHPDAMAAVEASKKAVEYEAMADIIKALTAALTELPGHESDHPLFARVALAWRDQPEPARSVGIAMDVALVHIASMSNLFAALGWNLVELICRPETQEKVRSGDRVTAELCALEATRLAQRSIMARYVLQPLTFDVGDTVYEIPPGTTVATLLPLTNTSAAPGLESWDLAHWNKRRLADPDRLAAVELVTVFGHGRHTCPAQPFSLAVMTRATTALFGAFSFDPRWSTHPKPVTAQIGGVARSEEPCVAHYERR